MGVIKHVNLAIASEHAKDTDSLREFLVSRADDISRGFPLYHASLLRDAAEAIRVLAIAAAKGESQ